MKKLLIVLNFMALVLIPTNATEVRLLFNMETGLGHDLEETLELYKESNQNLYGFSWEVILNSIGLGMHYGVFFESFEDAIHTGEKEWWMDWKGDIYFSYHILGGEAFIDPFVEIGIGNAGRTFINNTAESDTRYRRSYVENLSLFSYIAGGVSLNLDGFILGGKANYFYSNIAVPGTNYDIYSLNSTSLTIYTGISI